MIDRMGVPREPIRSVRVGNLEIPAKIILGLIQYFTAKRQNAK
jgi:hypothetical protein